MSILKRKSKKPRDKVQNFYIMKYWGMAVVLLCIPFISLEVPQFHPVFANRYWLLADVLLLWAFGLLLEKRLFRSIVKDEREKKEGKDALNVSSLLFFANPFLFIVDCLAVIHLYAMWYLGTERIVPGPEERLQCAAIMIGLFFFIYGKFLPILPYGNKWGIKLKKTMASEEQWKALHKKFGKYFMTGGCCLLVTGLFIAGGMALMIALIGMILIFAICIICANANQ